MNKTAIIATKDHYLYQKLKKMNDFFDYSEQLNLESYDYILDFSLCTDLQKETLIKKYNKIIFSDMSFYQFSNAKPRGMFSTVFPSPNKKFEWFGAEEDLEIISALFNEIELTPLKISNPTTGFIFPRILVQVINEAFFTIEEKVALAEDIDVAMLFGVNYPRGPVSWGKEAGLNNVKRLLDLLMYETSDPRYQTCELLKKYGNN